MESVMAAGGLKTAKEQSAYIKQQMPLTFLKEGESAHVLKIRGNEEFHHHLENLGFVVGAPLRLFSEQGGNIIVEIKGTQIALDKQSASKVITY